MTKRAPTDVPTECRLERLQAEIARKEALPPWEKHPQPMDLRDISPDTRRKILASLGKSSLTQIHCKTCCCPPCLAKRRAKQATRMIRVVCYACGCVVRMTRHWIEKSGVPTCGCRGLMAVDDGNPLLNRPHVAKHVNHVGAQG